MPDNKNMLKDETLEVVTGGVIPKDIEGDLLDFARNWVSVWVNIMIEVDDKRYRLKSRDELSFRVKTLWSSDIPGLNIESFLICRKVAHLVTPEDFVDFVWNHRDEIPYVG